MVLMTAVSAQRQQKGRRKASPVTGWGGGGDLPAQAAALDLLAAADGRGGNEATKQLARNCGGGPGGGWGDCGVVEVHAGSSGSSGSRLLMAMRTKSWALENSGFCFAASSAA